MRLDEIKELADNSIKIIKNVEQQQNKNGSINNSIRLTYYFLETLKELTKNAENDLALITYKRFESARKWILNQSQSRKEKSLTLLKALLDLNLYTQYVITQVRDFINETKKLNSSTNILEDTNKFDKIIFNLGVIIPNIKNSEFRNIIFNELEENIEMIAYSTAQKLIDTLDKNIKIERKETKKESNGEKKVEYEYEYILKKDISFKKIGLILFIIGSIIDNCVSNKAKKVRINEVCGFSNYINLSKAIELAYKLLLILIRKFEHLKQNKVNEPKKESDKIRNYETYLEIVWVTYDVFHFRRVLSFSSKRLGNIKKIKDIKKIVRKCSSSMLKFCKLKINNEIQGTPFSDTQLILSMKLVQVYSIAFGAKFSEMIIRNLVKSRIPLNNEFYENIIRKHIDIKITNKEVLNFQGYSGNNLVKISGFIEIKIPASQGKVQMKPLVIKISDREIFDKEKRNYQVIPPTIKRYFANISDAHHIESENYIWSCLIMEDLSQNNYETLFDIFIKEKYYIHKISDDISRTLIHLLNNLYDPQNSKCFENNTLKSDALIKKAYFSDIFYDISRIYNLLASNATIFITDKRRDYNELYKKIMKVISGITRIIVDSNKLRNKFKVKYFSIIHGDLNLKNIMVYLLFDEELKDLKTVDIKLIDIDNLRECSDFAYDIGELISDIELLAKKIETGYYEVKRKVALVNALNSFKENIKNNFIEYAKNKKDDTFNNRLLLSQMRSYVKLLKLSLKELQIESKSLNKSLMIIDFITNQLQKIVEKLKK